MTAQVPEQLIYNGERTSFALPPDLPSDNHRIVVRRPRNLRESMELCSVCTGCYRGYVGTWEIKDGRLYLVEIEGKYQLLGSEPLFADWFTGVVAVPRGEVIGYFHGGYGCRHEEVVLITVEQGVIGESRVESCRGAL